MAEFVIQIFRCNIDIVKRVNLTFIDDLIRVNPDIAQAVNAFIFCIVIYIEFKRRAVFDAVSFDIQRSRTRYKTVVVFQLAGGNIQILSTEQFCGVSYFLLYGKRGETSPHKTSIHRFNLALLISTESGLFVISQLFRFNVE